MSISKKNTFVFPIPNDTIREFIDIVVWDFVKRIPLEVIIKKIFAVVHNKEFILKFAQDKNNNGPYAWIDLNGAPSFNKHQINVNSQRTKLTELPAVLVHEILHSIFPQLCDDKFILELEFKVMKRLTCKQVNSLMHKIFKHINWEYLNFERRVESEEHINE